MTSTISAISALRSSGVMLISIQPRGLRLRMGFPVAVADGPPRVFQSKPDAPVALNLLQVASLVAQQALVVLVAWQDVDRAPEAGPACEAASPHVPGQQASGGADYHHATR